MKVAVPTRGNEVDSHFGHCEVYTIFSLDENRQVSQKETLPSPQGCGCKSNIAGVLQQKGVSIMLAGNMGMGAYNVLNNHGIRVYRGCSGDINRVVDDFLNGKIIDSNESCSNHDHHHNGNGHVCNH
jgi:predicted Fe-Mo cluster-binding NifX family protein